MDSSNIEINRLKQLTQEEKDIQLIEAAEKGRTEKVKELIKAGANLEAIDKNGATALIWATMYDHASIVVLLIRAKANLNAINKLGSTALICATCFGNVNVAKILIQAGANLNIVNKKGETALSYAIHDNTNTLGDLGLLFSAMTTKQIQQEINLHPNIQAHFDNFKQSVKAHRMSVFKILGPLALDLNANNPFSCLPTEVIGLIASKYIAAKNEVPWQIHHAELDVAVLCNAFNKLYFTPSFTGQSKGRLEENKHNEDKGIVSKKNKLV